jgi:hypothetical protein
MSHEVILMMHPTLGVLGLITAAWMFGETLNASEANIGRIRTLGLATAVLIWGAYIVGGYFYVLYYGADKATILSGPWTISHNFFMETKEHAFFMVLMLATLLCIAAQGKVDVSKATRKLVLYSSGLLVLMIFAMEGAGAMISMGVKVALMAAKQG